MSLDICVVILTYDRGDQVTRLVRSLREFHGPDLEIVVTDDGSDPKPNLAGLCTHLWQVDDGIRAATARNRGVDFSTYDKILLLDDDVIPHPLNLHAHSLALEMYDVSAGLLPRGKFSSELDPRIRFFFNERLLGWKYAWTGNLAFRRNVWKDIGGFDERFNGGHGYEDWDWAWRAQRAGYRIHLNRLAMAIRPTEHTAFSDEPNPLVLRNKRIFEEKWNKRSGGSTES